MAAVGPRRVVDCYRPCPPFAPCLLIGPLDHPSAPTPPVVLAVVPLHWEAPAIPLSLYGRLTQCLLHEVGLALVAALGLVVDLALELEVAPAQAVVPVQVVAPLQVAVADPPVALGGVALAHAVAVEPPTAQALCVAPLLVVVAVRRVDVGAGAAVAWCCFSLTQSAPGPSIPLTYPF